MLNAFNTYTDSYHPLSLVATNFNIAASCWCARVCVRCTYVKRFFHINGHTHIHANAVARACALHSRLACIGMYTTVGTSIGKFIISDSLVLLDISTFRRADRLNCFLCNIYTDIHWIVHTCGMNDDVVVVVVIAVVGAEENKRKKCGEGEQYECRTSGDVIHRIRREVTGKCAIMERG